MFDIYREQIMDRSQNPRFAGHLENATHSADGENRSCGDEIHIELQVIDGTIARLNHTTRACAVCTATADLLAEELQGKPLSEIETWDVQKITNLLGIPLSPVRLKCALLPIETVRAAIGN